MVNKKSQIKFKSFPYSGSFGGFSGVYTDPATGSNIVGIGGETGVDWDSDTFTMTAGGSGVADFTTLFTVGSLVINAAYNGIWANVVSVTATDVVFDGDLGGYQDGKFYEADFAQWTDPDEAFKLVLNPAEWPDPSTVLEVTCWYPGSQIYTACTHPAKVVSRDGQTLTLDRPVPLIDSTANDAALWEGQWLGQKLTDNMSMSFWGGDGYYYDTWLDFPNATGQIGFFEYWDSYGKSNSNQTEEQLYAKIDKQIADLARVLGSAYPETDWYIGTPRLGEYMF
jgi:hypothetical protein